MGLKNLFKKRSVSPANSNWINTSTAEENKQVERNLKGIELEKAGQTEEAMLLYLENITEGFDGSHPYNRLAVYYRKRKEYEKEIEVLDAAINLYKTLIQKNSMRSDLHGKILDWENRKERALLLKSKTDK